MAIQLIHGNAHDYQFKADLIFTDPPYDLSGTELNQILSRYDSQHLLLITSMRQLAGLLRCSDWDIAFDLVLDAVVPKQSKSVQMPNYVHQTIVYLKKPKMRSLFNRKLAPRSDTFDGSGYWPTILRAPRERLDELGYAKSEQAMTDLLAAFDCQSIVDMFAGTGTNGLAALNTDKTAILIEQDQQLCQLMQQKFAFLGTQS